MEPLSAQDAATRTAAVAASRRSCAGDEGGGKLGVRRRDSNVCPVSFQIRSRFNLECYLFCVYAFCVGAEGMPSLGLVAK